MGNEPSAQTDLAAFVHQGVRNLQLLKGCPDPHGLTEQLLSSSNRTFLAISLVLRTLFTDSLPTAANGLLNDRSCRDLFGMYGYMLGQISENDRPMALKMLNWVMHTARPPQLQELALIRPDTEFTESDVSRISGGFLITSKCQMVCFIHKSAKAYLQSLSHGWAAIVDDPNETIAHTCMTALPPILLLQSLGLPASSKSDKIVSNFQPSTTQLYAFNYWIFHYRLAEPHSRYLSGLFHSCLQKSFEHADNGDLKSHAISLGSVSTYLTVANVALKASARVDSESLARLELQMGATSHLDSGGYEDTALHLAAMRGHIGVATLLLQYDAEPRAISSLGYTPLFYAVAFGHDEMVRLLFNHRPGGFAIDSVDPASKLSSAQELTLTAVISTSCTECGELQVRYVVSSLYHRIFTKSRD